MQNSFSDYFNFYLGFTPPEKGGVCLFVTIFLPLRDKKDFHCSE